MSLWSGGRATPYRAYDRDQDHGSHERHDDAAPEASGAATGDQVEYESANERAHQSEHDVADDPVAATLHHDAGQPTGNQSNNEPGNDAAGFECHLALPTLRSGGIPSRCTTLLTLCFQARNR